MPNKPQTFWKFSLQLYSREGVAAACLELQDAYQLDVNLILFCFWHGSAYGEVDQELLQKVIAFSIEWRSHVVQPLRSTRTWMKLNPRLSENSQSLRERIKADELIAEKIQQEQIASLTSTFNNGRQYVPGFNDGGKNIDHLLYAVKIERDERITRKLEVIRDAIESLG
ncbi:MAG: TIGR02444 family protein [Gammaproteobacteria bacterium]|nr:TIGR02444 family protein [Gammaproteobacteria bacterium]